MAHSLESLVIRHTRRLPVPEGPAGEGTAAARQFDAVLTSVGFKLSAELLERLSGLSGAAVVHLAERTLPIVSEMVGDHVPHNAYFIDFPANVPDTEEFWARCVAEALGDDTSRESVLTQLAHGVLDLLSLPTYGRYQHTYEEMLAAQDELITAAGDRVTVLHLGRDLDGELTDLYLALAGQHDATGRGPPARPRGSRRAMRARPPARVHPRPGEPGGRQRGPPRRRRRPAAGHRHRCAPAGLRAVGRRRDAPGADPVPQAVAAGAPGLLAGLDAVVAANPAKLADVHAHRSPSSGSVSVSIRTSTRAGRTPPTCSPSRGARRRRGPSAAASSSCSTTSTSPVR